MSTKESNNNSQEQFKIYGHELLKKVKELIKEGNIRRIIIKDEQGRTIMEIPVTLALLGGFFAPVLAALGAAAALLSKCTILVERKEDTHKVKKSPEKKQSKKKNTKKKTKKS